MSDRASSPSRVNPSATLLTAEDVAARWQVPKSHVYRLAREGKVPVVVLGKYRRFRLAAIEQFEVDGGCER